MNWGLALFVWRGADRVIYIMLHFQPWACLVFCKRFQYWQVSDSLLWMNYSALTNSVLISHTSHTHFTCIDWITEANHSELSCSAPVSVWACVFCVYVYVCVRVCAQAYKVKLNLFIKALLTSRFVTKCFDENKGHKFRWKLQTNKKNKCVRACNYMFVYVCMMDVKFSFESEAAAKA